MEIAVGAVTFVALAIGAVAGLSPRDWTFWYLIPFSMILLGLLLAKRAYLCVRHSRALGILFAVLSAWLIITGAYLGYDHYWTTPMDMAGHIL